MAKPKIQPPKQVDIAEAVSQAEVPQVKWKVIGLILVGFALLWVTALMTVPAAGYWVVGIVSVLTVAAAGFGIYIWRMTSRQKQILDIMKGATDGAGRAAAIEALAADSGDAMKQLARAQLVAQTDPQEALEILEAIEIKKAQAVVQDEVRSQLGMMYLMLNRPKDARPLADEIGVDRQPDKRAKAKYAAIVAEAFARTGSAPEAKELIRKFDHEDPELPDEIVAIMLRSQVFVYTATKNRGLASKALDALVAKDPNMVAPFLQKGVRPELQNMAKKALGAAGMAPRQQMKFRAK